MKLKEIAILVEIAGGVAIIATLIFVVFEINQNTRAIRAQTAQAVMAQLIDFQSYLDEDPEKDELFTKVVQSGFIEIEPDRQRLARRVLRRNMMVYDNAHYHLTQGTLDEAVFARYQRFIDRRVESPWFQEYWETDSFQFSDSFIEYIEGLLDNGSLNN